MDINELLRGVDCACGRKHTCGIGSVYIEKNAFRRLDSLCGQYRSILLVADENTFVAAGAQTVAALPGKTVRKLIFSGARILVPNEAAIRAVEDALADADLILGVGSGVIQDLCKYVSFDRKIPYIIVATAPSMDGYASNGAAMITGGMKVTYPAGLPAAILADTEVIRNAPIEMLQAGYGDIIGKLSALNDWKLSHLICGEYFCRYIYDLTYAQIEHARALADGILKRDEESVKALMEALIVIGILMSFAGSSRPASGSEHHLSHFFEITGLLDGTPYFPHGIDVAYSTVITAGLRETLLTRPFPPSIFRAAPEAQAETIKQIYKSAAEGCMALQNKTGNYTVCRGYLEKEQEIRAILREMPTAEQVTRMLAQAGLDMADFYRLYCDLKIRQAILSAKDLKDRYTVLWLYYDLCGGDADV